MLENIIYLFVGSMLTFLGSFTERWSNRNQQINDFVNGLHEQMLVNHPRLVLNYANIKDHLEPLSRDTVQWISKMLTDDHKFTVDDTIKQLNERIKKQPQEIFDAASKIRFDLTQSAHRGISIKSFDLSFLENNLVIISLLDKDLQRNIWKIINNINLINQETDRYLFYFNKTFEPKVMETNETILINNMKSSLEMISMKIREVANVNLELLKDLKAFQNRWTFKFIFKLIQTKVLKGKD